jgi:3D (Asp-Asp-Asp) domain-containing protein
VIQVDFGTSVSYMRKTPGCQQLPWRREILSSVERLLSREAMPLLYLCSVSLVLFAATLEAATKRQLSGSYEATAYSIEAETASGIYVKKGVIAADPRVLPIGTKVRVSGAGRYSGVYVVADTGRTIIGREIDIYVPNDLEAKRFGRKLIRLKVLKIPEEAPTEAELNRDVREAVQTRSRSK